MKLNSLKWSSNLSLQENALEVKRLVELAYVELPEEYRDIMVLETFCNTLDNAYLQRHLLAIYADNVDAAVRAETEFLQIKPGYEKTGISVRNVEEDDYETEIKRVDESPLNLLREEVRKMTAQLEQLKPQKTELQMYKPREIPKPPDTGCWLCGKEGHLKRNCPTSSWNKSPAIWMLETDCARSSSTLYWL